MHPPAPAVTGHTSRNPTRYPRRYPTHNMHSGFVNHAHSLHVLPAALYVLLTPTPRSGQCLPPHLPEYTASSACAGQPIHMVIRILSASQQPAADAVDHLHAASHRKLECRIHSDVSSACLNPAFLGQHAIAGHHRGCYSLQSACVCVPGDAQLGSWQSHPLIRALLSQPAAQAPILQGLQRLLHSLPRSPVTQQQQLLQQLVQPFLSFAMLCPDTSGECKVSPNIVDAALNILDAADG